MIILAMPIIKFDTLAISCSWMLGGLQMGYPGAVDWQTKPSLHACQVDSYHGVCFKQRILSWLACQPSLCTN